MSKYAGMREDLVQAGGGNSAYKISKDMMAIKASGYQLADLTEKRGYAIVNPEIISNAFSAHNNITSMTEADSIEILNSAFIKGDRPSIETFLHSIAGKYTLHTHPNSSKCNDLPKGWYGHFKRTISKGTVCPIRNSWDRISKNIFYCFSKQQ